MPSFPEFGPGSELTKDVDERSSLASSPHADESQTPLRQRLVRFGSGIGQAVLFAVLTFLVWFLWAGALQDQPWIENELTWTVFSLLPAVTVTTALLLWLGRRRSFAAIGLHVNRSSVRETSCGFALCGGLALGVLAVQWLAGWIFVVPADTREAVLAVQEGFVWEPSLAAGLLALAVGSVGEELLFRGYGMQQLIRATGPWVAVAGSSILFGLVHGANPQVSNIALVNTVLFGMLFGFALVRHRSLWLPFGMHFGWNVTLATVGAPVSGIRIRLAGQSLGARGPELLSGGDYGPEASLVTALAMISVAWILWKVRLTQDTGPRLWD